jgi:hypothetical protein
VLSGVALGACLAEVGIDGENFFLRTTVFDCIDVGVGGADLRKRTRGLVTRFGVVQLH